MEEAPGTGGFVCRAKLNARPMKTASSASATPKYTSPTECQRKGRRVVVAKTSEYADYPAGGFAIPAHDREHRDPGGRVLTLDQQRERPEVRGRPEEDDQEEEDRRQGEIAGRRGPSDQRWNSTRGPPDDDVLDSPALQPPGVDEHVEEAARPAPRSPSEHSRSWPAGRRRRPRARARTRPRAVGSGVPRRSAGQMSDLPSGRRCRGRGSGSGRWHPHRRAHRRPGRRPARPGPAGRRRPRTFRLPP